MQSVPITTKVVSLNPVHGEVYSIQHLCGKVCQWLATGRWLSPGTPASSTNKTDRHDITEILLKVALNIITITLTLTFTKQTMLLKDSMNKFGIKYWTSNTLYISNFSNMGAPCLWICKKKYDYWWKNTDLQNLTGRLKLLNVLNRAIWLKPGRESHPLCLVWWAI
jgi:hypothetical protein